MKPTVYIEGRGGGRDLAHMTRYALVRAMLDLEEAARSTGAAVLKLSAQVEIANSKALRIKDEERSSPVWTGKARPRR